MSMPRPRIAVHKFSSCDGCQLAFLNLGEDLLQLAKQVDICHFAEAGPVNESAEVDIAFVEGSLSTPEDLARIRSIRDHSRYLVTIGACATSGGLQALRNITAAGETWPAAIYARPEHIAGLDQVLPIAAKVKVDLELWGCPINGLQIVSAVRALLLGVNPRIDAAKVCQECKRRQTVCVMVSKGVPCLGPVTRSGCGALCPAFGRDCYACYGPAENANHTALAGRFEGLGLLPPAVARRFLAIHSAAEGFHETGLAWRTKPETS